MAELSSLRFRVVAVSLPCADFDTKNLCCFPETHRPAKQRHINWCSCHLLSFPFGSRLSAECCVNVARPRFLNRSFDRVYYVVVLGTFRDIPRTPFPCRNMTDTGFRVRLVNVIPDCNG